MSLLEVEMVSTSPNNSSIKSQAFSSLVEVSGLGLEVRGMGVEMSMGSATLMLCGLARAFSFTVLLVGNISLSVIGQDLYSLLEGISLLQCP